jgi:hypothetical protein
MRRSRSHYGTTDKDALTAPVPLGPAFFVVMVGVPA